MDEETGLVIIPEGVGLVPSTPGKVEVIAAPHPFSTHRVYAVMEEGRTITEILAALHIPTWAHVRVFLEDQLIPRHMWPRVKPRAGRRLTVRVVPTGGGGGGGDDNKTTRIVLQVVIILAVAVLSYFVPALIPLWFTLGSIALAAVQLIFPPTPPTLPRIGPGGSMTESPSLTITGARNQANLYGKIARVLGRYRVYPSYGALSFTEILGSDTYLRLLFCLGYGPLQIEDMRIGDTAIGSFQGVEVETRQGYLSDTPLTLFPRQADEEALSILLSFASSWQSRTSVANADELGVDVNFPGGIAAMGSKGLRFWWTVDIEVQYCVHGTANWQAAGTISASDATTRSVSRGLRWAVARGQYDIRCRRTTFDTTDVDMATLRALCVGIGRLDIVNHIDDFGSITIFDLCYWSVSRSFTNEDPLPLPGMAKVALRIKATDQLHGMVDSFNCVATSILKDWDAGTDTWIERATRNPAACYREVLQGAANHRAVADARVDLTSLAAWSEACTAWGFSFDHVVDYGTTVFELLKVIASGGRAAFSMVEDRYGVIYEHPQTTPIQHFTPRNSNGFRGVKAFPDRPHALKMKFINPEKDWQQDERIVYDDGYNADGSGGLTAASRFETIDLPGCTSPDAAWKHGRYHLAQFRLRPETYELIADIENLVCTRGDLVYVTHDIPLWGLGWARVKSWQTSGGKMTSITVDDIFPMEAGKTYRIRVRARNGTSRIMPITTIAGYQSTLTLNPSVDPPLVQEQDLVMFGETAEETVPLLVKVIEPRPDFGARIQLVDAAANIIDADTGAIPAFESHISVPPEIRRGPPTPIVDSIRSDETVLIVAPDGALRSRIVLSIRPPVAGQVRADFIQVRFRETGSEAWVVLPDLPGDAPEASLNDVRDGEEYDIRLRSGTLAGSLSDWAETMAYTCIGKTSYPPDPVGLIVQGNLLTWDYPSAPLDLAGFKARRILGTTPNWDNGIALHAGVISATNFVIPPMEQEWTFMVKAVDVTNRESLDYTWATAVMPDIGVMNILEQRDEHATGFLGTKVGCAVDGVTGDLEANSSGDLFWGANPLALFWTNDAALFWTGNYDNMSYTWTYTTGDAAGTRMHLTLDTQGTPTVSYKKSADGTWLTWPGTLTGIEADTAYDLRVELPGGQPQGRILQLVLIIDADDMLEEQQDVAIATGTGTRLTLTEGFRVIKTIQLTVQAFGAETAIAARAQDKDAQLGPLIQCLDAGGAVVAGHVDVRISGF